MNKHVPVIAQHAPRWSQSRAGWQTEASDRYSPPSVSHCADVTSSKQLPSSRQQAPKPGQVVAGVLQSVAFP
jgi:hypothetical protein